MQRLKFNWMRVALVLVVGALSLSSLAPATYLKAASPATGIVCTTGPNFTLTAQAGYIQMPDMNTMYMWSYGSPAFQRPRPVLCVNQGDTVTMTLQNSFTVRSFNIDYLPGTGRRNRQCFSSATRV